MRPAGRLLGEGLPTPDRTDSTATLNANSPQSSHPRFNNVLWPTTKLPGRLNSDGLWSLHKALVAILLIKGAWVAYASLG